MPQYPNVNRAAHISPWLGVRRLALSLLACLLVGLTSAKACADVVGLMVYQVRVHDGKKWHAQKLAPGTCLKCGKGEWKFLTGTDWPDVVKVEVFWRWTGDHICNACPATAFRNGALSGAAASAKVDGFSGVFFTYQNQPKHSVFNVLTKVNAYTKEIVSPQSKITLQVIPISKVPWVTVATPEEGDTFPAGPSVLVAVKSSIAKKPTTVRLEVHKKVGGKWTWAPPGAIDLAWASFPFNLPATQGDYRIRVQGKKGPTIGVYSQWRTFKVQ